VVSSSLLISQRYPETYNIFTVVSIRKTGTDGLINEEHVRVLIPRIRIEDDIGGSFRSAWSQLHEETESSGTPRAAVYPKDHIVFVRLAPTFEEIEEKMLGFNVNVASVGSRQGYEPCNSLLTDQEC
jgi:hypothetical protein